MTDDIMTNEGLRSAMAEIEADRASINAATKRIQLILDTKADLVDDRGYVVCTNHELDEAQQFIRNNLDLAGDGVQEIKDCGYEHLSEGLAQKILDDLKVIWADEFSRDVISEWAISMSLCPLHFCDWASCFDDEDPGCYQIRIIFPCGHDT